MYKARTYRRWVTDSSLVSFEVVEKETDLYISAARDLKEHSHALVSRYRKDIEQYISRGGDFYSSLEPIRVLEDSPAIVKAMADASRLAGVGPMAAVAGAMAEFVGRGLLDLSDEVIVENGGDIFLKTLKKRVMGIYAGEDSPFTGKLALEIGPAEKGLGVCTSSGTVSHSLSFGKADAALIVADSAMLADAVATAAGNMVRTGADIEKAIGFSRSVEGVKGVVILIGSQMGSWGGIKLV